MSSDNTEANSNAIAGALTYPDRSDQSTEPVPNQPRQPRNLQGLLRFAMEATKAEDAPLASSLGPMDRERQRFLEEALRNLTVDMAIVLQDAIDVLANKELIHSISAGEPTLPENVKTSFRKLLECVDDIDIAMDFWKMGGFAIFPIAYGCGHEAVRSLASAVLGECCQNNRYCQQRALESGLLGVLMHLMQTEWGATLNKCLYAISCCCREYPPACEEFLSQGGCSSLVDIMVAPERRGLTDATKAIFIIEYFCRHYPQAKKEFIDLDIIEKIAEHLKSGQNQSSEHLLRIIMALLQDEKDPMYSKALERCRNPKIGLARILANHLELLELEGGRFVEEKEYCNAILEKICGDKLQPDVAEEADR